MFLKLENVCNNLTTMLKWRCLGSTPRVIQQIWESAFQQTLGTLRAGNPWTSCGEKIPS